MAAITKKSTIGEVLNMNIETATFLYGNRHALPRLPGISGREHRGGLHGTRHQCR